CPRAPRLSPSTPAPSKYLLNVPVNPKALLRASHLFIKRAVPSRTCIVSPCDCFRFLQVRKRVKIIGFFFYLSDLFCIYLSLIITKPLNTKKLNTLD
ncbi:hypothetical protein Nmel_005280, partial [Mimus melanotis]